MAYYERLRWLREQKEELQKDTAKIIGTSTNYYGDYEQGKRDIPFERVIKLAKHFNVSLDYIAEIKNNKEIYKSEIEELWQQLDEKEKDEIKNIIEYKIKSKKKKEEKRSVG